MGNGSEWLIRMAMLLSFSMQVILTFLAPMRRRSSHPLPHFAVWSSYLLAGWVAVVGLGLLLYNICSNSNGSSSSVFAFWTPFLLLHLGGPDTITAFSLDDNEIWLRYLVGMLLVVFSALVVFFCSVKSNPLVIATVVVFVVGVIKYGERIYSLYSGSVRGFRDKMLDEPNPGPNYAKLMTEFDSKKNAGLLVEIIVVDGEETLEQGEVMKNSRKSLHAMAYEFFTVFRVLFVNLILSYKERRLSQAYFLDRDDVTAAAAFEVVDVELGFLYDMVYTKAAVSGTKRGCFLRFVGTACLVVAVVLFVLLDKASVRPVDRGITYVLLLGGLALDVTAYLMLLSSDRTLAFLDGKPRLAWLARVARAVRLPTTRRWSEQISKLSLINYSLGKPKEDTGRRCWCCRWMTIPSVWRRLILAADLVGAREILDDFFVRREPVSFKQINEIERKNKKKEKDGDEKPIDVLKFVFDGVRKAANQVKYSNHGEMKELCGYRGEGTLNELAGDIQAELTKATRLELNVNEEEESRQLSFPEVDRPERKVSVAVGTAVKEKLDDVLRDSVVVREFEESLLLWHVATDLCSHRHDMIGPQKYDIEGLKSISETLSEYMLYLLVRQPEMLPATATGVGLLRYRDTYAEARRFFQSAAAWDPNHQDARRMLLGVNTSKKPAEVKGDRSKSVLFDACILAKVLLQLSDDTMWRVVAGVWREMLTYVAGKCHGSTHARQLSRGGELITMVWLLVAHMGIGDMYRIHEPDVNAKLVVLDQ